MQNVYNLSKSKKTISLNFDYNVLFCNKQDALQICTMAYQIGSSYGKWLVYAYTSSTSNPYEYLVQNHHPSIQKKLTVATNILLY